MPDQNQTAESPPSPGATCSGCAALRNEIETRIKTCREWGAYTEAKGNTTEATFCYGQAAGLAELLEWIDDPTGENSKIDDPNVQCASAGAVGSADEA